MKREKNEGEKKDEVNKLTQLFFPTIPTREGRKFARTIRENQKNHDFFPTIAKISTQ